MGYNFIILITLSQNYTRYISIVLIFPRTYQSDLFLATCYNLCPTVLQNKVQCRSKKIMYFAFALRGPERGYRDCKPTLWNIYFFQFCVMHICNVNAVKRFIRNLPRRWHSGLKRSPRKLKVGCSNPSSDRPKS